MKSILFGIFLFHLIFGCKNKEDHSENELIEVDSLFFDAEQEKTLFGGPFFDTLFLAAQFDECGEYGGHTERFKIYRNDKDELRFSFTKDKVDCETLATLGDRDEYKDLILEECQEINDKDEEDVSKYLHSLLEESIMVDFPFYPKRHYTAFTQDSSLVISFPDITGQWKGFEKMKSQLLKK